MKENIKSFNERSKMEKKYHVLSSENGWVIKGASVNKTYKTKINAVTVAKKMAAENDIPLVIHTKDGRVNYVSYSSKSKKLRSTHVKRRLNNKSVRNSIADVI